MYSLVVKVSIDYDFCLYCLGLHCTFNCIKVINYKFLWHNFIASELVRQKEININNRKNCGRLI